MTLKNQDSRFYHKGVGCLRGLTRWSRPPALRASRPAAACADDHARPKPPQVGVSSLRDLALFVGEVLSAGRAELLDLELLGHRPFVLRRRVVGATEVVAGHLDDVTHGSLPGRAKVRAALEQSSGPDFPRLVIVLVVVDDATAAELVSIALLFARAAPVLEGPLAPLFVGGHLAVRCARRAAAAER